VPKCDEEQILGGWVVIGHEVRSFEPCDGKQALWLMGDGSVLREIMATYNSALQGANPYKKIFMVLGGELTEATDVGIGAEYKAGFKSTRIVSVSPEGNCTEDVYIFDSPIISKKMTFDPNRLDDNGLLDTGKSKRALAYEFCIPDTAQCKNEVKAIDPTLQLMSGSPGRIGCGKDESLCIGSTHQREFKRILQQLTELNYIKRIDECFFE